MQANFQQRIVSSHCNMSSEFITTAQKPTGTVYRFIRVPEITQNTNTVVLIKNSNPTDANNIAKVQKHIQSTTPPTKIITTTTAPMTTIDNTSTVSNGGKKVKTRRDDIRRFQHNQIERARREKINNWIMVLGRIIDDNSEDDNTSNNNHTNKNGEALSKGGILEKACEYIRHLKSMVKEQQSYNTNDELENEVRRLSEENELLRIENNKLKRKYHIEGLNDEEEDFLLKRPKSENDDFKLDMPEFCDSLPGDDITT